MDHFGDIATQPIYTYPYLMSSEAEHIFHVNSGRDQLEGANSTHIDGMYWDRQTSTNIKYCFDVVITESATERHLVPGVGVGVLMLW